MKIYGCEFDSNIDGGAPGYAMIGPFATKLEAENCVNALNKIYEEKDWSEVNDFAREILQRVGGYGYQEGMDSKARVVELEFKTLPTSSVEDTYDLFVGYYNDLKQREKEYQEQRKRAFEQRCNTIKQMLANDEQDVTDMTINNFDFFFSYTQQVDGKTYDCKIRAERRDNEKMIYYYSECEQNGKEYDINNNKQLMYMFELLYRWCTHHLESIVRYKECWNDWCEYKAIYNDNNDVNKLRVCMACEIMRLQELCGEQFETLQVDK